MSLILLLVIFGLIIFLLLRNAYSRPPNFPPGPPSLPVWGSYWLILALNYKFTHVALDTLGKLYKTKILGFYVGGLQSIVTLDYKHTYEVLTRPEFQNRVDTVIARMRAEGKQLGLFFSEGDFWVEQKRFIFRYMRDFGLGRRSDLLEDITEQEIKKLFNLINDGPKNDIEKTMCTKNNLLISNPIRFLTMNIAWQMIFGETFPEDKKAEQFELIQNVLKFQRSGEPMGGALVYTPWLQHVLPNFSCYEPLKESHFRYVAILKRYIKEHRETYSDDQSRGFVDIYLKELKELDPKEYSSFSDEQLIIALIDLLFPSTAGMAATIGFMMIHIVRNPKVQVKIQEELDTVVGRGRWPTLNDRPSLPYVEATIREGFRHDPINPLGFARRCDEDTTLDGYFLPKGTLVFPGAWSCHMDKEFWGDPENFRPERFIDEHGDLIKKDYTVGFGGGKRVCMGETFTKNTIFLLLTALFQNYTIGESENGIFPKGNFDYYLNGGNSEPKPYWVKFTPRD